MNFLQFLVSRHLGLFLYNIVYLSSSLIGEQLHHRKFVSSLLIGATNLLARWHSICSADTKSIRHSRPLYSLAKMRKQLEKYGIKGTAHKLIRSYLSNRKQVCILNNSKSQQKTVQCGIPQGSNLGPLLLTIYINDLPNCLKHTQASMFADDTNLTCTGSSANEIEYKLNSD